MRHCIMMDRLILGIVMDCIIACVVVDRVYLDALSVISSTTHIKNRVCEFLG